MIILEWVLLLVVAFLIVMSGKEHIVEVLNMVEHVMKEQMEVFIVRIPNEWKLKELLKNWIGVRENHFAIKLLL